MTYYNPFLGLWGLVPGGRALAHADQRAWAVFNEGIATTSRTPARPLQTWRKRFRIGGFEHKVMVPGRGWIPLNVALTCRWTWFCSTRFFGDPHANRTGYRRIAQTFVRELRSLLPS